jgi:hypothetical protein
VNIFTQIWSGAKCGLDIYHWGAGLAVTGRIRDIGQNVVKSTFKTGASNTPHLLPNFLPYRFPVVEIQYNNYSMTLYNYS